MTKSGSWIRGHHTRRRWELVKAAAAGLEGTYIPGQAEISRSVATEEMTRRGWSTPDSYRHFGIELEVICRSHIQLTTILTSIGLDGRWTVKRDGSLVANAAQKARGLAVGYEAVSKPLRGRKGLAEVAKVMSAFEAAGVEVNKTCGGHVHHEAADFQLAAFKNLARTYERLQTQIDATMPKSRRSTEGNRYCKPIGSAYKNKIESASTVQQLSNRLMHDDRYHVLNLQAYASYGTVEFRQHAGTVDAEKMTNWILFTQALVKAARKNLTILPTASLAAAAIELGCKETTARYFRQRARSLAA